MWISRPRVCGVVGEWEVGGGWEWEGVVVVGRGDVRG
jgi:hypothetical protein